MIERAQVHLVRQRIGIRVVVTYFMRSRLMITLRVTVGRTQRIVLLWKERNRRDEMLMRCLGIWFLVVEIFIVNESNLSRLVEC
jgi:phosphate starvation-inducible membrane PsiE